MKGVPLVERARDAQALIEKQPGIKPCELAERYGLTRGMITHVVSLLVSWDVVERVPAGRGYGLWPRAGRTSWLRKAWR